ncbi:putative membrane protein [Pediococcus claussenii ATCC BAA-344]|uniref:Membrane protein n=2 Tax=Pediococcus claussenii TaxID=187452 RepID=G8PB35_PEDCP|nr:putative membrane protein [Pediococcus claussenii ATCC BAA-344]
MMYITENHTDNIIVEIFYALATITIIFNLIASIRSFKRE